MRKLHDMSMVMKAMNLNNHMSAEELMGDMPMRPMHMEAATSSGTSDTKPPVRSYPYSARRVRNGRVTNGEGFFSHFTGHVMNKQLVGKADRML